MATPRNPQIAPQEQLAQRGGSPRRLGDVVTLEQGRALRCVELKVCALKRDASFKASDL
jgi:hypothetical protein